MQFQSIASGSNGNCSVWNTPDGAVLFDAGISRRRVIEGLKSLSIPASSVKYVCITHAHSDHISGLPVLMEYLKNAKVVATSQTIEELSKLKKRDPRYVAVAKKAISVEYDDVITIGKKFEVSCFATEHDIAGASGYRILHNRSNFAVSYVTDTASLSSDFVDALSNSDIFFLESNHDIEMLEKSKRPYWLKMRIKKTHLSNNKFLELTRQIVSDRTKVAYLGHLSGECNNENLVYSQISDFTRKHQFDWVICTRSRSSAIFTRKKNDYTIEGGLSSFNDDRELVGFNLENYF